MGTQWVRVASDLDSNPKIRKAGRNGREVFLFALRRNGVRYGTSVPEGILPAADLDPEFVADVLKMPVADAAEGLAAAIAAGLLVRDGEAIRIAGYDSEWTRSALDGAERQDRWRKRHKVPNRNANPRATAPDVTLRVTDSNGRVTESDGVTRYVTPDQIRSDQKDTRPAPARAHDPTVPSTVQVPTTAEPGTPERAPVSLRVVPDADPPETTAQPAIVAQNASQAPPEPHEQAVSLAALLMTLVCENNPTSRIAVSPEDKRARVMLLWAADIERIHDNENRAWGTIHGMIEWCQRDPFWRSTILGGAALRDKWDTMQAQKTHRVPNGKAKPAGKAKRDMGPTPAPLVPRETLQSLGPLAARIAANPADPALLRDLEQPTQDDPSC